MKKLGRWGAAAGIWCLAFTILGACGSDETGAADGGRIILSVAYEREIDVLNAFTSQNLVDIAFSMVEGLITADDNNTYIPVLAKEIPTEENGLIVRNADGTVDMKWELHPGVLWHDGEELTSKDVCFTWSFVTSEGSQTYNRHEYLGIIDCLMPDAYTVVFRWDDSYGYYAGLFEAVLPEHILGGKTTEEIVNYVPYNRGPETIGTGPFKFAEWKSGEYIRVVRNEDYWRGPEFPAIDEIVWSFIPDSNTRLNAMKAGRHHYARLEPTQVIEVQEVEGYDIHLVSQNTFMHFDLSINLDRGRVLFGDPTVRQAIFHAIDREAIADQLMQGTVTIANTPINPNSPYFNAAVPSYEYDPVRARRMLDQAGWVVGPDGIREKDDQRFSFVMLNRAGSADRIDIAQVIQAQLKEIGIEVQFETLESAAWTQKWRSGLWEGMVSAWFLPADPSITGLYACDGPNNMTGLCHPELDEAMEASDRALSFEERKPLLDEAQERLAKTARSLPIYYNVVPELVSTRIGNFRASGTNFGSFWNLYEWTLR
ncbi:MAG: peptide ABC transporter substrate-binding protein [Longimicrobiales bacterium]|nr:peptide ABC transporter substrate-binding protein [Longimicrobiales bacterium]